ncbi:MAG: AMIN domain-containing protein, partial [Pseudomonadota bacterium]
MFLCLLLLPGAAPAAMQVTSTRVWPAQDYTRITLESAAPIEHQVMLLKNPDRLVLDLANVAATSALEALAGQVGASDPYVKAVRIGRFKPGVVRLVFDLKAEAKPEVFTLRPVADYGHRLVLDIYPVQAVDPLLALLEKFQAWPDAATAPAATDAKPAEAAPAPGKSMRPAPAEAAPKPGARPGKPDIQRLIVVVVDAGHGGEDPGALGRRGTR